MTTTLENVASQSATDLKQLATDVVARAVQGGATAAECVVREGDEFSTVVRLGQVETLKESGSRAIGVRVFFGQRAASTYSSDFSAGGIERMLILGMRVERDGVPAGQCAPGMCCCAARRQSCGSVCWGRGRGRGGCRRSARAAVGL